MDTVINICVRKILREYTLSIASAKATGESRDRAHCPLSGIEDIGPSGVSVLVKLTGRYSKLIINVPKLANIPAV